VVWYVPRTVALVLLPHLAGVSREQAERDTAIVCRNTLLLSLAAALGIALVSPLIIRAFFTDAFLPALLPLWLLLPGIVIASWSRPMATYQLGSGRPLTSLY